MLPKVAPFLYGSQGILMELAGTRKKKNPLGSNALRIFLELCGILDGAEGGNRSLAPTISLTSYNNKIKH